MKSSKKINFNEKIKTKKINNYYIKFKFKFKLRFNLNYRFFNLKK